jgi:hypothetical protein
MWAIHSRWAPYVPLDWFAALAMTETLPSRRVML